MAGTYSVTVTTNGCTSGVGTTAVVVNATPATPTASSNTPVCTGNTINLSTPAVAGATYSWTGPNSFGSSVQNPSVTNATTAMSGTYSVTVTANGCTSGVGTTAVFVNPAIVLTISETHVSCFGGSNGTATVNASGGSSGFTYAWSPAGGTGATATGLTAGPYSVLVSDASGCTGTITTTITQPASPVGGTTTVTDVSCFSGSNGTINLTPAGGVGPYSYQWLPGGPTTEDRTGLTFGTYTVQITDTRGCTATVTATVTQPSAPVSGTAGITHLNCFGGATGAINLTPAGGVGPYSYQWLPSGPTTEDRTGLTFGTYTVQITDTRGCTATVTATVTQPTAITASIGSTPTACTSNTGTATVSGVSGGTPGYQYSWAPTGGTLATATGLAANVYTCTITDANGCTITRTVTVSTVPGPTLSTSAQTNVLCNGGNTGTASVNAATGGTGPYTYDWTPGTPTGDGTTTVSGLTAGVWTCTTTDANGCTATATFNITQPTPLVLTMSSTNVSCAGGTNGSATVSVTGGTPGYSYQWFPAGGTSATAIGLGAGCYTAQIIDANGCTSTQTVCITQPIALSVSSTVTNVSCNAGNNGSVTVNVIGGTGAYTYLWAPSGGTASSATGLTAQTYTCTITDNNGCTITHSVAITEPAPIVVTDAVTHVTCHGLTDGSATVTPSGGVGPFTYVWSPIGGTNATATGLGMGPYECTITDNNGCVVTHSVTITEPSAIVITITGTDPLCNGGNDGSATAIVSGGTPAYTYQWLPSGGNGPTATGLPAGCYTLQVTDMNGCVATQTVCLSEPTALTASQMQTNVSCNGGNNGDAMVMVTGGTPGYSYLWSPSGSTNASATGLAAGVHSCTITDANSCVLVVNFTITEPTPLMVTATQTNVTCNNSSDGSAMVVVSGGTPTYNYMWTPTGGTAPNAIGLDAGIYTCTITDGNTCVTTQTFNITEPAAFAISGGVINVTCNGGSDGAINIATTGGTAPYSWSWSNGDTTESISTLIAGTYSVTITDTLGCTFMTSLTVNEPAAITSPGTVTDASSCTSNDGAIDLSVSGGTPGYTYLWSNFATTEDISGLDGGAYSVTITDTNGCTHVQSFTITEPGAPTVTYSEPIDSACQNTTAPFTLTGETPAGGTFSGPGVSGGLFVPATANLGYNMITYVYMDSVGCSGSAMDSIWVEICMGITETTVSTISVYPNPTSGIFTVNAETNSMITVYDAVGNLVVNVKATSAKTEINLTDFADGIYMIIVQTDNSISSEKIILNK